MVCPGALASAANKAPVQTTCLIPNTYGGDEMDAYDAADHEVYVSVLSQSKVSIYTTPCTLSTSLTVGSHGQQPYAVAYNPSDKEVYVTDVKTSVVYALSGSTLTATYSGFSDPYGIAFDPKLNGMLVSNYGSNNLTFLNSTGVSGASIGVGAAPVGIAYDPSWNEILVANSGSSNLTVLNASNPWAKPLGSIPVGTTPWQIANDPASGLDYVTDWGSNNVSVVSGNLSSNVSSSIPIAPTPRADPFGITYSSARSSIYVGTGRGYVYIIRGVHVVQKFRVGKNYTLDGLAYDSSNHRVYAVGFDGTLFVLR